MSQHTPDQADDMDSLFVDEETGSASGGDKTPWKILIVDDEADVHVATKLVLKWFSFEGRGLEFIDAYSGDEACETLKQHPDTAMIFLDVVMETEHAGLDTVKRIRGELANEMVRIVLRTGQPGSAPEEDVIINYHINDYKAKSEMTTKKLFTTVVAALRSYRDLQTIEFSRKGLIKILDAASNMDFRSRSLFSAGLLMQLASLLDIGDNDLMLIRRGEEDEPDTLMAACGAFEAFAGEPVKSVLHAELTEQITKVFETRKPHIDAKNSIYLVALPNLLDVALCVSGSRPISEAEYALMVVYCEKIVLAFENYEFVEQSRHDQNVEIALIAKVTANAGYLSIPYAVNRGRLSHEIALTLKETPDAEPMTHRLPDMIQRAAMLADLGNLRISSDLLEKPSALSADETAQVRAHTELGAAMLQEVLSKVTGGRIMALAQQIALSHHESFDGSGYPNKQSGTGIPLPARIVAVADTYLAMTSPRPWRAALSHADTLDAIRQEAGRKFDPKVVDAFMKVADNYQAF
jgi:response regulator RpfG family c-di-GMP phosphodiesterase